MLSELRYAIRAAIRHPGATGALAVTLGLGLSAVVVTFAMLDQAAFRTLPYPDASRLVQLDVVEHVEGRIETLPWPYAGVRALAALDAPFEARGTYYASTATLTTGHGAERVDVEYVSPGYFAALGLGTAIGRTFEVPAEEPPGVPAEVVITHGLWQRHFGGDPLVIGRALTVNRRPLTVVGVARPDALPLTGTAELWLPHTMAPVLDFAGHLTSEEYFHRVVARLRPGTTVTRAEAEVAALVAGFGTAIPPRSDDATTRGARVRPLSDAQRNARAIQVRWLLFGGGLTVLLMAIVNAACVWSTRLARRETEFRVRSALGVTRGRLTRLLLAEMAVVVAAGALIGWMLLLGLEGWIDVTASGSPAGAVPWSHGRAAVFAAGLLLSTIAALAWTSGARWFAARGDSSLPRGGTTAAAYALGVHGRLLSVQVAATVALTTAALVMTESIRHLERQDLGLRAEGVVMFSVRPQPEPTDPRSGAALADQLVTRLARLPGVNAVTVAQCAPFTSGCATLPLVREGQAATGALPLVGWHRVGPRHFEALGVPLLRGRSFSDADRAGAPPVVIVSRTAAERYWPGRDPVGARIRLPRPIGDEAETWATVVGVAGDVTYWPTDASPGPDVYQPALQFSYPWATVLARVQGPAAPFAPAFRAALAEIDPHLPMHDWTTLEAALRQSQPQRWLLTRLLSAFTVLAMLMAAVGTYGVTSAWTQARRRELALRLALGAAPEALTRFVLTTIGRPVAAGVAGGLTLVALAAPALQRFAFRTSMTDPWLLAGVVAAAGGLVLAVAWWPAHTAARVPPRAALGAE